MHGKMYPPGNYIRSIEIVDLFGEGDVLINSNAVNDPRILVLYGRNGTGKTTILNIVRSLLSAEDGAGHRSRLSRIQFQRATVTFEGGMFVEAKKRSGLVGSYDWSVGASKREGPKLQMHLKARGRHVSSSDWDLSQRERYEQIMGILRSLAPEVIFLDDKRTFAFSGRPMEWLPPERRFQIEEPEESIPLDLDPVHQALQSILSSVRQEALMLNNRGNDDSLSIYSNILKGMHEFKRSPSSSTEDLLVRLEHLELQSRRFAKYGLATRVDHSEMRQLITVAPNSRIQDVSQVVNAYVDSLTARLHALGDLHEQLDRWIMNVNEFLAGKRIEFKISEGIAVLSKSDRPLPANVLSSGERHLLLMMSKAFLLRRSGGLMIVDEPELSLNATWQRQLISGFVDSFGGGPCQLLIASHSLEICSQYQNGLLAL